jgi:hypothetical protein
VLFDMVRTMRAMSLLQAAEVVLRESSEPLHSAEIVKRAVERGLVPQPMGRSPDHTLQAAVWRDINERRKADSPFLLLGNGRVNRRYWLKGKARPANRY